MFLAIDTVFEQCSVAVLAGDGSVLYKATQAGKYQQTEQILPMVDKALVNAGVTGSQLSALVFNRGPGAFSGIRINTSVVQALSVAWDIPCVGVSSLQALAQEGGAGLEQSQVYAVLDARMNQVYFGEFTLVDGVMLPISEDTECLLDYGSVTDKSLPLVGDGELLQCQDGQVLVTAVRPSAVTIGRLGLVSFLRDGGVSAELALPVYLRNHAWKTLKEQGKV